MVRSENIRLYQKIQIASMVIAILLLTFGNFAGSYSSTSSSVRTRSSYDVSTDTYRPVYQNVVNSYYHPVRLGSGFIETVMILIGIGAFGYALMYSVKNYNSEEDDDDVFKENTLKTINGAKIAVGLAIIGAALSYWGYGDADSWWLDSGFYGSFIGGLTAIYTSKKAMES